jgi:transcriptional regulator with XRE-family HTH domain
MKIFIGPRLRKLRREKGETQAAVARNLGISTSYVNLLENNERSISASVLLRLLQAYGVDWRDIADETNTSMLADMRVALEDPLFDPVRPDIGQLRAAMSHCPDLAESFMKLHHAHQSATEHLLSGSGAQTSSDMTSASPEALVHAYFRGRDNYFEELENAAEQFFADEEPPRDEIYSWVKNKHQNQLGLRVSLASVADLQSSLRNYDAESKTVILSEALDYPNRIFQLIHVGCLIEHKALLDNLVEQSGISDQRGRARCRLSLQITLPQRSSCPISASYPKLFYQNMTLIISQRALASALNKPATGQRRCTDPEIPAYRCSSFGSTGPVMFQNG